MKNVIVIFLSGIIICTSCADKGKPSLAPVQNVTDNYFGVQVTDPYRYMENMDDTIFLTWMKNYANYTRQVLNGIPGRQSVVDQEVEFDSRRSDRIFNLTISENGRYFYQKMTPDDEIGKLYYRDSYEADEVLLYDPAKFSDDESMKYVISAIAPDFNGTHVAISVAPNGSESFTMIIMDVATGKILPDRIEMINGVASWLKGGNEFIYGKYNSKNVHDQNRKLDTKIYYHHLGDDQAADKLVFSSAKYPDVMMRPEELPYIYYDPYEHDFYLLLYTVDLYLKLFRSENGDMQKDKPFNWKPLIKTEDQIQNFYIKGDNIYLYTAKNAPEFKIIRTSKFKPDIANAEVIVPETDLGTLSNFTFTKTALYYTVVVNGVEERLFRILNGSDTSEEIILPAKAGALSLSSRGHKFDDVWVRITGWTMDGMRYRLNQDNDSFTAEPLSSRAEFPEYEDLIVEELMVPSYDGVMVPLSLIYKKGTKMDGSAPVLMSGYGAYGISITPGFNPFTLIWTIKGGIMAKAHVRGGGELGDAWRLGGNKTTKPNTWKDLIACTEFLHKNKYSSPDRTAIYGGSAGGILIGRAITERPDLFAAAIPLVGAMNPLRGEESPNGPVNAPEFGTVKDSTECMALIEMDSYLKIRDGVKYPATLITAGFNDPRVIVWQPAKFAARLQAANGSKNPILFDVDYTSGHGIGDTKTKSFEDIADILSFALWQTGNPEFQPD